ncbi:MAG: HEAT repeat domain-containing protein [Nitrospirae bacterium]|nr:HEAT repeat domain-containing protein [Nitrospirota bacterium]
MSPSKKEIVILLEKRDYNALSKLTLIDKKVVSTLISLSYDKKTRNSWRAIEAIGFVTKELSRSNPDIVRNIAGRLLWMIRDESGGIGWSVPEILGEIVKNNPVLCSDIAPIIASFHEEKMLCSGVLWALGRIGKINNETVNYAIPIILSYLKSDDNTLRGYAAWALGEMGNEGSAAALENLKKDTNRIEFYQDGELKEKSVGELASGAIERLLTSYK